jgi:hypothetical protein
LVAPVALLSAVCRGDNALVIHEWLTPVFGVSDKSFWACVYLSSLSQCLPRTAWASPQLAAGLDKRVYAAEVVEIVEMISN